MSHCNSNVLKLAVISLILSVSCFSYAQLTDLARLEYSFIPKGKSEDQYTRLRFLFNYPIKIKEKDYLILGAEYNRVILNLEDKYSFEKASLETLHIIDFNVGYTFKTSEFWRLGFKINPRIASTLAQKITQDDLFLNGGIFFINDKLDDENTKRPYRLILGLTYNTTAGVPFPLPFVAYYRELNDNWSYTAGVPKSNLKYSLSANQNIQAFASLDGYFAHLQQPILVDGRIADNISLSVAVGGLGYEYEFTKHLVAYSYFGYTFRLNNVLRNDAREEIFKLDDVNAFYFRTGLKFKI